MTSTSSSLSSTTTCEVTLSSSDYLAGDVIRATVCFKGDQGDTVEWAAVQVHGHCWHDPRLVVSVIPQQQSPASSSTSSTSSPAMAVAMTAPTPTPKMLKTRRTSSTVSAFDKKTAMPDMSSWVEGTTCLFATKPHCLVAELVVEGENTYTYQATLPPVLPPSYRGVSTRYGYLFTICVKLRSEDSARVAHIPFYIAGTPGSYGDAARAGPPSSAFLDCINAAGTNNSKRRIREESSGEEEELVMLQQAMREEGILNETDREHVNRFPVRYDRWDPSALSVVQDLSEKVWYLEREEGEEETGEVFPAPSPRMNDLHHDFATGHGDGVVAKALNAQTSKGRLAKCFVMPSYVNPGDALNVRLDFANAAEKCLKVHAIIEVEERTAGPPPLVAVFEPLLRKRQGSGPWIRQLVTKTLDVSLCTSCAFSLSTYGVPPDFSTDLIIVHSYLRLEFTTTNMVCSLRIVLNVKPPARSLKLVSFVPDVARELVSPKGDGRPQLLRRFEEQSPPPTPNKKLIF